MQREELKECPQPAMLSDGECVTGRNEAAKILFPSLAQGCELPGVLQAPDEAECWEGCVTLEGRMYHMAAVREGKEIRYTFHPLEQQALTEGQLDGALYQVRTLMGEFYRQLAPCVAQEDQEFTAEKKAGFSKSYYRMIRLMDHLDFLRDAAAGQVRPDFQILDLNRMCVQTALECDGLLSEIGVRVVCEPCQVPVTVAGEAQMLREALVELLSNCAKRLQSGGTITLYVVRKGTWAMLSVTDDGGEAAQRDRVAMTARGTAPLIPMPNRGAGLGLTVAEKIIQLHGGAMLVSTGPGAPKVYLTMPLAEKRGCRLTVQTPRPERNAGMSPYLIGLSDVLPGEMIREDWKE